MNLLYMSISSGCIIIVTFILRCLFRKKLPVELFCIMWWLAIARSLIPFSVPSMLSIYNIKTLLLKPFSLIIFILEFEEAGLLAILIKVVILAFIIGIIALFYHFIKMHRECKIVIDVSEILETDNFADKRKLNNKISGITVKTSDYLDTPVTYGIWKPTIILPKNFDTENTELMKYVMLHEYTHVKQFHFLWKVIAIVVLCLHWYNPCMWLMYYCFEKDIELLCDKCVIKELGEKHREGYSLALIDMAKRQQCKNMLYSNFVKRSLLKERVQAIMKFKRTSRVAAIASACILLGTATAFATTDTIVDGKTINEADLEISIPEDVEYVELYNDETIEIECSYEDLQKYITEDKTTTRAASYIEIENYKYVSDSALPKNITVKMDKDGYTYKGTLKLQRTVYDAENSRYVGYYSGKLYKQ